MGLVSCSICFREYFKDTRHINENKKLNNRFFCSSNCYSKGRNKQIFLNCDYCSNSIIRNTSTKSPHNFCNHSCSAKYTNTRRISKASEINRQKYLRSKTNQRYTPEELRKIRIETGKRMWLNYKSIYSKEFVLNAIQQFVVKNKRIPLKREVNKIYHPARKHFSSWNNAIQAAGFKPNPALFAEHQVAKDGHKCDSVAEMLIDDYLYEKNIQHERCYPYPEGTYTADFKIKNYFVEYFGLAGEHKRYDELRLIKQSLATKYNLNLIEIYPKDIYPLPNLDKIFYQL